MPFICKCQKLYNDKTFKARQILYLCALIFVHVKWFCAHVHARKIMCALNSHCWHEFTSFNLQSANCHRFPKIFCHQLTLKYQTRICLTQRV